MKWIILVLALCCLWISSAQAQYTCNDRGYLRQVLSQLEAQCGGSSEGSNCVAAGYVGQNPEQAINSCYAKTTMNRQQCAEKLICYGPVQSCMSAGYFGANPEQAINSCYASTNLDRQQCGAQLKCFTHFSSCVSGGYTGATPEQAVNSCYARTNMSRQQCGEQLKCF